MNWVHSKALPLRQKDKEWGQKTRGQKNDLFIVKTLSRQDAGTRYGIVVKKKIGNAVTRNKIKRRLRHLIRKCAFARPAACIVIVKSCEVATCDFQDLSMSLNSLIAYDAL